MVVLYGCTRSAALCAITWTHPDRPVSLRRTASEKNKHAEATSASALMAADPTHAEHARTRPPTHSRSPAPTAAKSLLRSVRLLVSWYSAGHGQSEALLFCHNCEQSCLAGSSPVHLGNGRTSRGCLQAVRDARKMHSPGLPGAFLRGFLPTNKHPAALGGSCWPHKLSSKS